MIYFYLKVIKKLGAYFKIKSLSNFYKSAFLYALERDLDIIDYDKYNFSDDCLRNKIIWVYWAQGVDEAPPVVQKCIKTLKENCTSEFSVKVIDDSNVFDYISLPEIIKSKLTKGIISRTHFSDVVRFELLKEYGGIWIDSTVLVGDNFANVLKEYQRFITLKHNNYNQYTAITEGRWTSFFIGMPRDAALARFMSDAYIIYWNKHDKIIDYVLIDYLIALAYKKIPAVKNMINEQKDFIGDERWLLQDVYDKKISKDIDLRIETDNYKIYKLTYKINPPINQDTYYYRYFCHDDK
ncbi:capsular polysaccharide synthesis protein [Klebsiella aerogenes]|uniref:capsular polysaccharide synthesis protein n=1 Tax=Klebsiella aerogenes TaxID=548 RepID=UPI0018685C41|nr:capsular polysaccharide synthesis protein [Klebsiella aerogenes]MDG0005266.1 capsular polysaccharide synthesis protein [Klebsiella aerogenes]HEP1062507.1 hypothetical protein [Klebsiella aerogenes]